MDKICAVVVEPDTSERWLLKEVGSPIPASNEVLVQVAAVSLNRGEIRRSLTAPSGWQPGWDLAGVIETPSADGSSPSAGTRVVGFVCSGAFLRASLPGSQGRHIKRLCKFS